MRPSDSPVIADHYYRIRTEIEQWHPTDWQKVDAVMRSIEPILIAIVEDVNRQYVAEDEWYEL